MARVKEARAKTGIFAVCLLSLLDDQEDVDPVDRQAGALLIAEAIAMWRSSVTGKKGG